MGNEGKKLYYPRDGESTGKTWNMNWKLGLCRVMFREHQFQSEMDNSNQIGQTP